jgi:hypothetical protein
VAGDIRDQDAGSCRVDMKEVVEVSRHGGHREMAGTHAKMNRLRKSLRQNRQLNMPRKFQLAAYLGELLITAQKASHSHIAERRQQDSKSVRLDSQCPQKVPAIFPESAPTMLSQSAAATKQNNPVWRIVASRSRVRARNDHKATAGMVTMMTM